jgi:hypothetical protein
MTSEPFVAFGINGGGLRRQLPANRPAREFHALSRGFAERARFPTAAPNLSMSGVRSCDLRIAPPENPPKETQTRLRADAVPDQTKELQPLPMAVPVIAHHDQGADTFPDTACLLVAAPKFRPDRLCGSRQRTGFAAVPNTRLHISTWLPTMSASLARRAGLYMHESIR